MTVYNHEDDFYFIRRLVNLIGCESLVFTRENRIYKFDKKEGVRELDANKIKNLSEVILCQL